MSRLLYISNARLPTEKAHGLQIMKSCEAFAQEGLGVTLLAPWRVNSTHGDAFSYYHVKRNFTLRFLPCIDLFWLAFIPRRVCFYIASITYGMSVAIWLLFADLRGTRVYVRDMSVLLLLSHLGYRFIAEIHDYRTKEPKGSIKKILTSASHIVVNSDGTLKALKAHYPISNLKNVLVAPNGVDVDFFNTHLTQSEARKNSGLPQDKTIIGYVGRLETVGIEKGIPFLIDAWTSLAHTRDNIVLLIVGGPEHLATEYRKKIPNEFKDRIFFTGHVPYTAIPSYLRAIDIAVIPLPNITHAGTTSPIKLFEYMAAGKAIVVSDHPSLRAVISSSDVVEWYTSENLESCIQALTKLIEDKEVRERMGVKAKALARQFSWTTRAQSILAHIL